MVLCVEVLIIEVLACICFLERSVGDRAWFEHAAHSGCGCDQRGKTCEISQSLLQWTIFFVVDNSTNFPSAILLDVDGGREDACLVIRSVDSESDQSESVAARSFS